MARVWISLCLAACSSEVVPLGDGGTFDGGTLDAAADAGIASDSGCPEGRSTIRGTMGTTYFANNGVSMKADDLSGRTFAALVLGADDSFERHPATEVGAGSFTIECVPDGPYYLEQDWNWFADYWVTSSRRPDQQRYLVGSIDVVAPSQPTNLALELRGLSPWREGDQLVAVTTYQELGLPHPAVGEESLDAVVPLTFLIDSMRGDRAAIVQTTTGVLPSGDTYQSIAKVFHPAPLTTADGEITRLTGAFSDPITFTIALDWELPEFHAMIGSLPHVEVEYWLVVRSLPATTTMRPTGVPLPGAGPLVLSLATATVSRSLGVELPIPVLFAEDKLLLTVFAIVSIPDQIWSYLTLVNVPLVSVNGVLQLRPQLSPPRNLRVNGLDASQPLTGVGTTPTLTWEPPLFGSAARYFGNIIGLDGSFVAFRTEEPWFVLPPDSLSFGEEYVLEIFAYTEEAEDLSSAASVSVSETFSP